MKEAPFSFGLNRATDLVYCSTNTVGEEAMRWILGMSLMAMAAATSACSFEGSQSPGRTIEKTYPVGAFDKIELAGAYDATVRTGIAPSVEAKGGENVLDRLIVEVRDGKLLIHPKTRMGFHWGRSGHVQLTITVPQLHEATLAGSGQMNIDHVQGDMFEGTVAGSGGLTLVSANVQSFKLSIAGAGNAKAGSGKVDQAQYDIAGSGDVDAAAVAARQLKVSIAGAGGVKANASETADVNIMGSGDVNITGGAKCTISKAGAGDVHCS